MASKTVVTYFSDFSGKEIGSEAATVTFGLDGKTYEIDLTEDEQKKLREALSPYIDAGRPQVSRKTGELVPSEVRAWAVANGLDVPTRGRVPATVTEAYRAAH